MCSLVSYISFVQIMAWPRSGDKLLSKPMLTSTYICVTRPQCIKCCAYIILALKLHFTNAFCLSKYTHFCQYFLSANIIHMIVNNTYCTVFCSLAATTKATKCLKHSLQNMIYFLAEILVAMLLPGNKSDTESLYIYGITYFWILNIGPGSLGNFHVRILSS